MREVVQFKWEFKGKKKRICLHSCIDVLMNVNKQECHIVGHCFSSQNICTSGGQDSTNTAGFYQERSGQLPCSLKKPPNSVNSQTMSWHSVRPCWPASMPGNVLTFGQLAASWDSVQVHV